MRERMDNGFIVSGTGGKVYKTREEKRGGKRRRRGKGGRTTGGVRGTGGIKGVEHDGEGKGKDMRGMKRGRKYRRRRADWG